MPLLVILILTVTSVFSVIRARHDVPTLAFIISMYVCLVLLFYCLYVHDTLPANSQQKEKMRVPIWFLATILNVLFAYRVSTMLPLTLDCLVWAMAGSTSLLGFYVFFIYKEDKSKSLAAANIKTHIRVKSVDSEPFVAAAEKV
ncbi:hypothetical protein MRB53_002594 [Persea americana]|uniref:Uncharacterized protein n=1 Tax=Persea americana TaxID=3435 RepID=A0ACC2MUZ8_PERAE|nr:hypothetical protein MRB53_002594 [Persea americana]